MSRERSGVLQRARRAMRIARAVYRDASNDFQYYPGDEWRPEFAELKQFMRKAFQALHYNSVQGDYAEFGSYGARTFTLAWGAARLIGYQAHLWAFDSFQGLPEGHDDRDAHVGWSAGRMKMSEERFRKTCATRGVPDDAYTTVPGFFSDTLSPDASGPRPERVSFAYVDCDLYSSTVEVLRFLESRLAHGAVIAFDDWFCTGRDTASGERTAAREFFASHPGWEPAPFVQYGWHGMSFVLERR